MEKLDGIRIAKPCPARWSEMEGDEKARHCSQCNLTVYNLTAMTRAEAEELISGRQGRLCVRYYRRDDGRVMTSDCPRGVKAAKSRRRMLLSGGLLSLLTNLLFAFDGAPHAADNAVMGKMAVAKPQSSTDPIQTMGEPTMGAVAPRKPGS